MPKDTKTLGNNKARACESLGFAHKKRLCLRFDTTSFSLYSFFLFFTQRFQGCEECGTFTFFRLEPELSVMLFNKVFAKHQT